MEKMVGISPVDTGDLPDVTKKIEIERYLGTMFAYSGYMARYR